MRAADRQGRVRFQCERASNTDGATQHGDELDGVGEVIRAQDMFSQSRCTDAVDVVPSLSRDPQQVEMIQAGVGTQVGVGVAEGAAQA